MELAFKEWVNAVIKPISRLITPINGVMGPYLQPVFGAHFVLLLLGCRFAVIMAPVTTPIKIPPPEIRAYQGVVCHLCPLIRPH